MDYRVGLEMTAPDPTGCTQPVKRKPSLEHGLSTTRGTRTRRLGSWNQATTLESILSQIAMTREKAKIQGIS